MMLWKKSYLQGVLIQSCFKKSKEYSSLGEIIFVARNYLNFENEKRFAEYAKR